jgi:hypothetical protein
MSENNPKDPAKLSQTNREIQLGLDERREVELRVQKELRRQDQSLREGLAFLVQATIKFVFYVTIGAFVIMFGQDISAKNFATGALIMAAGAGLVIKGMLSLGAFSAK